MKWSVRKSLNYDSLKEPLVPIIFQTLDWHCDDYISEKTNFPEYKIFVFGITTDGFPVSLRIDDFSPFFYIEVPITWDSTCVYSLKEVINSKVIKKMEFLQRKKYYGFEKNMNRKFIKLSFYSIRGMRSVKYRIEHEKFMISGREHRFNLYESNIDTILRFTHIADILTAGWVQVQEYKDSPGDDFLITSWKSVKSFDNDGYSNKQSDTRVLYYDIEACSADGSFPNANKPNDRVTQICAIIKDSVTKNTEKYLFNVGSIGEIEDTTVLEYSSEKKMLLAYSSFIKDTNPDIIVGYNIFGFDNGYIFERAKILNITDKFNYQSKINEYYTEIISKTLNNQQSGFNEWKMTRLVGRIHIDLLQVIKKDFKLESYKLDYVGEHFIGQGKDDVTPKEIFEAWSTEGGTKEKRTRVGKYCVQDTNLCLLLFEKFAVLPNHIEMAKVTRVPIEYLITRGQSIKVFSQIAYETRKAGFLIPVLPRNDKESKFQGATVLEAKVGFYKQPVAGLDFASLYPSIMIAHNMCYSTVVLDDKYLDLPGVEYSHLEWQSVNDFGENTKFKFSFVQNEKGVLSGILENLWKARKVTKRQMNAEKDPFIKTVLNAKQLAIKVSMNSIYGFTGAVIGALPCLAISQSVTGCGRQMIEQTSSLARSRFNCEIIYGDSVTGDTPILIRINGKIIIKKIEEIFLKYPSIEYPQFNKGTNKEQSLPTDLLESWTANGWKPIRRIIKHFTNKNIYRVNTNLGVVDVTEDHSLLDIYLNEIKPTELNIGDTLYSSYPINIDKKELIDLDINIIKSYNNYKNNNKNSFIIKTKYKILASYYYLIGSLDHKKTIIEYSEIDYEYWLYFYNSELLVQNNINSIKLINENYNGFVYDIETEDGTFQAGIGQMIVKNTDSCYVIFPEPVDSDGSLTTLFKKAEEAAAEISKTFKKPIELEFEKFMYPLILVAKKRYMYVEWTDPKKNNGEIEAKGVELVRRDNCPYVKETLNNVLNPIMFDINISLGRKEAERHIDNLLNGKVLINKLILSKTLRNEYKNPEVIAHYKLVEKMTARDPNSAPKPGDRVPFVYVDIGDPKALSWKKVEDPTYVTENNVPIDYLYYLEHQLMNPLKTIFDILLGENECKKLFDRKSLKDAKIREKKSIGEAKRIKEGNKDLRSFFKIIIN